MPESLPACSAGLGLRRVLLDQLIEAPAGAFDFLECAPDNWIGVGGPLADKLAILSSRHALSCHGLSLSLGGPDPLDMDFVRRTRDFLERHQVAMYSEHLSYCAADGQGRVREACGGVRVDDARGRGAVRDGRSVGVKR